VWVVVFIFAIVMTAVGAYGIYVARIALLKQDNRFINDRDKLKQKKENMQSIVKVGLGLSQVLSLLPGMLDLVFPVHTRTAMSYMSFVVLDVHQLVQLDCWCVGHGAWCHDWYLRWILRVVLVPFLAVCFLLLCTTAFKFSRKALVQSAYTAVMYVHPRLSATIFQLLLCRDLGPTSVIEADYSVSCDEAMYTRYWCVAIILVVLVPLGVPVSLLYILRSTTEHTAQEESDTQPSVRELAAVGEEVDLSMLSIQKAATNMKQQQDSTAVLRKHLGAPFTPECYWFEPVDLLRKLALTGILQFFSRGSQFQVFLGCCIAVGSLVMQLHFQPYVHGPINTLHLLVDLHICLTFLVSFVIRTNGLGTEAANTDGYAGVLFSSIIVVACVGLAMFVQQTVEIVSIVRELQPGARLSISTRTAARASLLEATHMLPADSQPAAEGRQTTTF
jgi:hypothetical protein